MRRPVVANAFDNWLSHNVPSTAAGLAYYTVFSLAPLLLIAIGIAGMVFGHDQARDADPRAGRRRSSGPPDAGRSRGCWATRPRRNAAASSARPLASSCSSSVRSACSVSSSSR